ncbi:MAG: hypothetical protein ACT4TC_10780, partial [Myxococcaceae bacterium]
MEVERPAALALALSIPSQLTAGQTLMATLSVTNSGTATAKGFSPSPLTITGPAGATLQGG